MEKKVTLVCENCGCSFSRSKYEAERRRKAGKRVFCSQNCASKIRAKECLVDVKCKECGTFFSRKKSLVGENVFCSRSCSNTHSNKKMVGPGSRNYKHGKSMYRYNALKNKMPICEVCGFDKEYAIEVHHIDKNRENNSIENLMIVCANCHTGIHKGKINI